MLLYMTLCCHIMVYTYHHVLIYYYLCATIMHYATVDAERVPHSRSLSHYDSTITWTQQGSSSSLGFVAIPDFWESLPPLGFCPVLCKGSAQCFARVLPRALQGFYPVRIGFHPAAQGAPPPFLECPRSLATQTWACRVCPPPWYLLRKPAQILQIL